MILFASNPKQIARTAFYAVISFTLRIPNYVLYGLLFLSLLVVEYYNFHLSTDSSIQLHTLTNFVSGHGITTTTLDSNFQVVYQPCSLWPAGLVILLTPFYLLTGSTVTSLLILTVTGFAFFSLFLSKYLDYLQVKDHQKKFIIFFFMVSVAPFVEFYVSDVIATTICLWSFYFYLQYLDHGKRRHVVISIFLVALCYFIKYSFLPFLFYPALALVLKEKLNVFKKLKSFLFVIFVTCISGLFFYMFNRLLVGPGQVATSWDAFTGHAHWLQLTRFNGFLFTFGTYEWFFQNMIRRIFDISITFNLISLLVTFYLFWILIKAFFSRKENKNNSRLLNSVNISLSTAALIIGMLVLLTLNNPGQTWTTPYWTFVEETRYYGPVIIMVLINVLILFFYKKKAALLHIIVPLMIVLNLFAYRAVIQSGFWGDNYRSYLRVKKNVDGELSLAASAKRPVVYFEKDTKNSGYYDYLQADGVILEEKDKMNLNSNQSFTKYLLKKDSTNSFNIVRVN